MQADSICHSCGSFELFVFYEMKNVPVHSMLLIPTKDEAINYPKGDISLAFCRSCGFISNVAFDPQLNEYSSRYEETQRFSPTFNVFHRNLAIHLIERYNLYNKDIIEIGCGKGDFLSLLCELGKNRGVGFDPAYVSERSQAGGKDITFIQDFYSDRYLNYQGDFICCKMTLEHIQQTADFISMVRQSIKDKSNTIVFFQVPDASRILRELAFWDIYYEHCSYFSLGSLARLFRKCGYTIMNLWKDYDDQYLMIESCAVNDLSDSRFNVENDLNDLTSDVQRFEKSCALILNDWNLKLSDFKKHKQKVVVWGAGSKAVSFLTTLNIQNEIQYVVDINPFKAGMYLAGTGQQIAGPEFLKDYRPDVVLVMNSIYLQEIRQTIENISLESTILAV